MKKIKCRDYIKAHPIILNIIKIENFDANSHVILPVDLSARVLPRQVSLSGSASHHVSLCPSRLNSSQEPEENRVAPLRPIALRRSSQWQNHQILRENISTQGTVRSESQCTSKYSQSVLKCSKNVPQKSVKSFLYTWALSISWRLHL